MTPVPRSKQGRGQQDRGDELGMSHKEVSLIDLPGDSILDTAPVLTASPHRPQSVSPRASSPAFEQDVDVDPEKPGYANGKMDKVLAMLNHLTTQNASVEAMRDEMRVANVRLNARLSAVENVQRSGSASPASSTTALGSDGASSVREERRESRVPTDVARQFYQLGQEQSQAPASSEIRNASQGGKEADRIEALTATNRQLMEMVAGFAAELEVIKGKMGGGA